MAKPKPETEPEPEEVPDEPEQPDAEADAFLARVHAASAEGAKAGMEEWVKNVVAETDLDQIDEELNGKRPGVKPGRPAAAGGAAGQRAVAPRSSFGRALLELAIGKPRSKTEGQAPTE